MTTTQASARDHRAWSDIFDRIDRQASELRSLRIRIAHELGWERVHPRDLNAGDRVRSHLGDWYQVAATELLLSEPPTYRIYFADAEGAMDVEAEHDGHPWPPMVTRAYEAREDIF
jgi:hypothetical protein